MHDSLPDRIAELWDRRDELAPSDTDAFDVVRQAIDLLDRGEARVAEVSGDAVGDDEVVVNEWLKLSILLLFRLSSMESTELGPFEYADKIPLKRDYQSAGVRVVPGASARWGSHLANGVVLMPSYTNIGAFVGENSMVDTWATVGSCAQIGSNVHLSGGVGIGGVLEPPNAAPVIVGDECMIGSRCIVAEGARVGAGSVLGAGCILTGSIPSTTPRLVRRSREVVSRRGASPSPPPALAASRAASSGCPACSSSSISTGASATTSRS